MFINESKNLNKHNLKIGIEHQNYFGEYSVQVVRYSGHNDFPFVLEELRIEYDIHKHGQYLIKLVNVLVQAKDPVEIVNQWKEFSTEPEKQYIRLNKNSHPLLNAAYVAKLKKEGKV